MTKLQQKKIQEQRLLINKLEQEVRENQQVRNSVARELFKIAKSKVNRD